MSKGEKMNVDIDITGKVFKTERLILREWRESDLEDFFYYARVPEVGNSAGWPPHKTIDDSKIILDRFMNNKHTFCLEYNGKAIGSLGIQEYDEEVLKELDNLKAREIGYAMSKDFWGMGLMPEAVNRVIDYLFNDIKLDVIVCSHNEINYRSRRVQEKCGFKNFKKVLKYENTIKWINLLYKENKKCTQ